MDHCDATIERRGLTAELAAVRAAVWRYAAQIGAIEAGETADASLRDEEFETSPDLDHLCAIFGLTPFERAILVLCAGVEIDGTIPMLCAAVAGDRRRIAPTFRLALAALPDAHWSALSPDRPLRRWRLIEVGQGEALVHCPLRIDERVLHYLIGGVYLDTRLRGLVAPAPSDRHLTPSLAGVAETIADALARSSGVGLVTVVSGSDRMTRQAVAAAACEQLGLMLWTVDAASLPANPADIETVARLWEREAALGGAALLVEWDEAVNAEETRAARRFCEQVGGMLLMSSDDYPPLLERPTIMFDLPPLQDTERLEIWRAALGPMAAHLNGALGRISAQFRLSLRVIHDVGREVAYVQHSVTDERADLERILWQSSRRHARPRMSSLAQRIESSVGWDDLALPSEQLALLRAIVAQARQRTRVYHEWGFAQRITRGLGISALFAGPSGVGKTLAAEVIANELQLDLYRIDLSQVVSKYVGETEKNLRWIFDAAEQGGAILLFDEADALFGRRSEVKDSHDRYANIEVSYLLQRMEAYHGLAILTTNMRNAIDSAFLRRIRFIVQFPFPDTTLRAAIWRMAFPPNTPTDGLEFDKLARLSVSGGNIRNIALGAAFLAADEGAPVQMRHILMAARAEYAKLEKTLSEAEIAGWIVEGRSS